MNDDLEKTLVVVGDLHYETEEASTFELAHSQIRALSPHVVVSLGDLGGYSHPGTRRSFEEGYAFFCSFGCKFYAILGNHDFEGPEYTTDEASILDWCEVLRVPGPYQIADLGGAVGVFLSQTEYRTNRGTEGEVHLDRTQVSWLEKQLTQAQAPTFVFSHAPILGSGIRILQEIHLRHPNAWLNHADGAEQFLAMVGRSPWTRLWFSGHNHLGHNYGDSVTTVGNCTFVHVGVIGSRSRDGQKQSRVLKYNRTGWRLFSLDHNTGNLRADFECDYNTNEVRCLFTPTDLPGKYFPPPPMPTGTDRLMIGRSVFLLHRGMLLEYNAELAAPLGVVATGVHGWSVTCEGGRLMGVGPDGGRTIFEPNPWGWFFKVHSPNPYLNISAVVDKMRPLRGSS